MNQLTAAATPGLLMQKVIGVGVGGSFGWYFLRRPGQFESEVRHGRRCGFQSRSMTLAIFRVYRVKVLGQ